ncbi:MAG: DUF2085 domain-containing protein [Rhodothermales bacterium]
MTGLLVFLATLPPFVGPRFRFMLMQGFSTVCHQIPERSFAVDGVALAVCHRCYAIYWGLPLAALLFLGLMRWEPVLGRHARYILLGALVPVSLDWALGLVGLWHNTPLSRTLTGGFFGFVVGLYVARAMAQAFHPKAPSTRPSSTVSAMGTCEGTSA